MDIFLNNIKRYISLTAQEESALLAKLRQRVFLKGQFILQAGDIYRYQTFILSGKVRTFYYDIHGKEHIVAFGIKDWWAGDIGSFSNQTPAEFNTQCLETTEVVQIAYHDMEQLYNEIPKLERYFRIIIQKAYSSMSKRVVQNHAKTAKERYLAFCASYPDIEQLFPQYMVASYIGVTKEFLSNIRRQIAKEGKG